MMIDLGNGHFLATCRVEAHQNAHKGVFRPATNEECAQVMKQVSSDDPDFNELAVAIAVGNAFVGAYPRH